MPVVGSDLPNASAFLANALPWPPPVVGTGSPQFYVNIHRRQPAIDRVTGKARLDPKGKQIQYYPGKGCTSAREAANYVAWANSIDAGLGTDIYVCMSGQREGEIRLNGAGKLSVKAIRAAHNAVILKGLWLDVDVKPDEPKKGYATTEEAANEFGRIRRAIGLPPASVMVYSGSGGFHAHWIFTEAVGVEIWEPLAHALVAAVTSHGFRGDTGCTIDVARLLRIPDTWNHKAAVAGTGPKSPVVIFSPFSSLYTLDSIAAVLAPFKQAITIRRSTHTANVMTGAPSPVLAQSSVDPDSLSAGITAAVPASILQVAEGCPFIKRTLITQGKDNLNPLWMATCRAALFTSEGNIAAHWMAQGYSTYTFDETENMYERVRSETRQRNMGWPKCSNFAAQGAPECKTCPHLPEGKSPFNFVPAPAAATVAAPAVGQAATTALLATLEPLPKGYTYGVHGCVFMTVTDAEGNQLSEPVSHNYPMLQPWMQDQPASFNFSTTIMGELGAADRVERQIKIPLAALYDKGAMGKELSNQHVVLPVRGIERFGTFMVSWIDQLRANTANMVQSAPYGWYKTNKGDLAGFIYAKRVWSKGAPQPASNPDPRLERDYNPTGALDPWLAAAKMITDQKRPELDAIVASAFGGPLVGLVGQTGLFMSTYSPRTGIGKTSALRVAQAVWGDPIKGMQSLSDTINSVVKKLGDLKNLPVYWDELKTDADTKKFVQLVFQLAIGKEKSRLTQDIAFRQAGSWETLLVSSSNDSLMSHITAVTKSTDAGVARIFEYEIRPGNEGQISNATATQVIHALNDNYGVAGLKYAMFLGQNHEWVAATMNEAMHSIEDALHVLPDERFWASLVTVVLMGAKFANYLGLTTIDAEALSAFMIHNFQQMRTERKLAPIDLTQATTVLSHLGRYLNVKRWRNTIYTDKMWTGQGRPSGITLHRDINSRVDEPQVHFATEIKLCRLMKAPFVEWMKEQDLSTKVMLKELKERFAVTEARGRLGSGTTFATQLEAVLDLDGNDPAFQDIFTW